MTGKKKGQKIEKILAKAPERYQKVDPLAISLKDFEQLLPNTIPKIIREDIVLYFNYIRNSRSKESLQLWEKKSGCTDSPNSWKREGYRPIFAFLYYDRITDGLFLGLLLDRIEPIAEQEDNLMTIEEFNRQCRLAVSGLQPKIDAIDFKILKTLSENPSLVIEELSEKTGHSYAAVYRHYQKLKRKLGLRTLTRINYGRLGIQPIFFITQDEELFDYFMDFKIYLDGQATFLWGKKFYLRCYFVDTSAREKMLEKFEDLIQEKEHPLINLEIHKIIK
jgi:DNA-binding Lrp family transcriptional regulator